MAARSEAQLDGLLVDIGIGLVVGVDPVHPASDIAPHHAGIGIRNGRQRQLAVCIQGRPGFRQQNGKQRIQLHFLADGPQVILLRKNTGVLVACHCVDSVMAQQMFHFEDCEAFVRLIHRHEIGIDLTGVVRIETGLVDFIGAEFKQPQWTKHRAGSHVAGEL